MTFIKRVTTFIDQWVIPALVIIGCIIALVIVVAFALHN